MRTLNPYELVVDYLVNTIGCTLSGLGEDHEKVKPMTEARIVDFFEKYKNRPSIFVNKWPVLPAYYRDVNTDGGKIGNLTEEEIAVAAAKGWTIGYAV